jgi:hypothetical protein
MRSLTATLRLSTAIIFASLALAACVTSTAQAQTYRDVPKSYWDHGVINWVTNRGPAGARLLDDYTGKAFEPSQPITRQQLAAAVVTASGHLIEGGRERRPTAIWPCPRQVAGRQAEVGHGHVGSFSIMRMLASKPPLPRPFSLYPAQAPVARTKARG